MEWSVKASQKNEKNSCSPKNKNKYNISSTFYNDYIFKTTKLSKKAGTGEQLFKTNKRKYQSSERKQNQHTTGLELLITINKLHSPLQKTKNKKNPKTTH